MTILPTEQRISCVRSHNRGRMSVSYTELAGVGCERLRRRRAVIICAIFRGDRC